MNYEGVTGTIDVDVFHGTDRDKTKPMTIVLSNVNTFEHYTWAGRACTLVTMMGNHQEIVDMYRETFEMRTYMFFAKMKRS